MAKATNTSKTATANSGKSNGVSNGKMSDSSNGTSVKNSIKNGSNPQMDVSTQSGPRENDSRLEEFFHDELKDIYWAEKHLVKTLPKMQKAANATELKTAFADHLSVTKSHVERLDQVFGILGKKPQAKKCEAMEGITKEGESIIEDTEAGTSTRDVGLILAAQKVEHYEIATYGTLCAYAKILGEPEAVEILLETLKEENAADKKLSEIAESSINIAAAGDEIVEVKKRN